jgi:hypothetical protein
MRFPVRVFFSKTSSVLVGQVRRLADEFGRPGITAKRGQTNRRVRQKGYLRLVWPNRRLARAYQSAVAKWWGGQVTTRRFKCR